MRRATASVRIQRPRAAVLAALADLALRSRFLDHFLQDWQVTSAVSRGEGATARLRAKGGGGDDAIELKLVEVTPERIVEEGRGGRAGRRRWRMVYELDEVSAGATQVRFSIDLVECSVADRASWPLMRTHLERQYGQAMLRLKGLVEGPPAGR
jgi:hypothetical protein